MIDRRGFIKRFGAAAGSLLLAGCDQLGETPWFRRMLDSAEDVNRVLHRALIGSGALAREYHESEISPDFRANGTVDPDTFEYMAMAAENFAGWRLDVTGLVERPMQLSLDELRAMPSRTQITRHDCVEGWSCIGKWTGVPLKLVLDRAGLKPNARYIVFYCADDLGGTGDARGLYYESIDLDDAYHPQTILAYQMNGQTLPIPYGAPLRLRVERQLGYKMAKYILRIEAVESFANIAGGRGGFWEDRGYEWYAGI